MKMSWVTLDRIVQEQAATDKKIRRRLERSQRPLRSMADDLSDERLLDKLRSFGLDIDRDSLERMCKGALSVQEVAGPLMDSCGFGNDQEMIQGEWIWVCLTALWERWWPQRPCLELLDDKVQAGYRQRETDEGTCAATWLDSWSDVLHLCDATGVRSIRQFDDRFPMTQSLYNWSQDLEECLWNAGLQDRAILRARVAVCEEALRRFPNEDQLMTENRRRDLAETYFELGETEKAERLFESWLDADPRWGFGWVGWAICHFRRGAGKPKDYDRAAELLTKGYHIRGVRDRDAIESWLRILYKETGQVHAAELIRPAEDVQDIPEGADREDASPVLTVRRAKVARNQPCPCGSGKKFKWCCGASE